MHTLGPAHPGAYGRTPVCKMSCTPVCKQEFWHGVQNRKSAKRLVMVRFWVSAHLHLIVGRSYRLRRAHRSHRWGHRFESCCDHQHRKVLVNQGLFFFVLFPAEGAAFPRRQGAILDVNKMNDQPVHASRCER